MRGRGRSIRHIDFTLNYGFEHFIRVNSMYVTVLNAFCGSIINIHFLQYPRNFLFFVKA
jgi:hypothetical protein